MWVSAARHCSVVLLLPLPLPLLWQEGRKSYGHFDCAFPVDHSLLTFFLYADETREVEKMVVIR